jgi:hypothetical protein
VQQPGPEHLLERAQGAGDGGLGDAQLDGGVGEAAGVDDRDQAAKLAPTRTWSTRAAAGRRSGSGDGRARPQRNRVHIDVWVPHDQAEARVAAAIAAGGRLVTDEHAPSWWTLARRRGQRARRGHLAGPRTVTPIRVSLIRRASSSRGIPSAPILVIFDAGLLWVIAFWAVLTGGARDPGRDPAAPGARQRWAAGRLRGLGRRLTTA